MKTKLFIVVFLSCTTTFFAQSIWPWGKTWRMSNNGSGHCYSVCTDAAGNVYAAGIFDGTAMMFDSLILFNSDASGSTCDSYVAKYDSNGNILWVNNLLCPNDDAACGVATDSVGNVFITGGYRGTITFSTSSLTSTSPGYDDIYLVKYDTNGNMLWAKSAGGSRSEGGSSVSIDAAGNAYITGTFNSFVTNFGSITLNHTSFISNLFLAKYDANGNEIWVRDGGATTTCYATSVSAAPNGNVYMAGYFQSNNLYIGPFTLANTGNETAFLACYDATGTPLWAQSPAGTTYRSHAMSVSADAQSNAFITGDFNFSIVLGSIMLTSHDSSITRDMFIAKYTPSGNVVWAKKGSGTGEETGYSVSADQWGSVYVTGGKLNDAPIYFDSDTLVPAANSLDPMFIVKYGPEGNVLCADVISSGGDITNKVAADLFGNAYAGGDFVASSPIPVIVGTDTMEVTGPVRYIFIAKYSCTNQVSVNELEHAGNLLIYPNPSEGKFILDSKDINGNVFIFNMLGEMVFQARVNSPVTTIDLSGQASGIYFVHVKGEKENYTQKIIVQ